MTKWLTHALLVGLLYWVPGISLAAVAAPDVAMKDATLSSLETLWDFLDAPARPDGVGANEPWVHIDLLKRELVVYQGGIRLESIPYLAYGAAGSQAVRLQGSKQTPTGIFTIRRVNRNSKFRLFFGIDYPTPQIAQDAWKEGILSDKDYRYYLSYRKRHGIAPADTPLGGYIGIHGLGRSPLWIHRKRDWTAGCVAVTNAEILALNKWLDVGTKVVIRG
ncbi:L,D-transpeptidase family protein [Halomonas sp. M20]|uniref:L,D-transpeptidase family protein n=1 Tax=Halomonas sp. M20 TaxID=2763264 RepID=UPI001D0AB927|nr:L,D-transpeptidase [Halomonas sp. M20]